VYPVVLSDPIPVPVQADDRLAEFHQLSGHPGPVHACQTCAGQLARQRQAATALRRHQRQTRHRIDRILEAGR
jgi:hypothetical protein